MTSVNPTPQKKTFKSSEKKTFTSQKLKRHLNPRKKRRLHPRSKKDIYSVLQHHPSGIAWINWTFSNYNFTKTLKHVNNKSKKLLSINVCCTNLRIFISTWKMPLYCIFSMHNFVFFFFFIFLEKAKLFFKMTIFCLKGPTFCLKGTNYQSQH